MGEDTKPRSVDLLIQKFSGNPTLLDRIKIDPIATLREVGTEVKQEHPPLPPNQDRFTYRTAVLVLSATVILVVLAVSFKWIILSGGEFKVPEVLVAIGSTALGALAGLLMPSGTTRKE